jgi:hypothetical protein
MRSNFMLYLHFVVFFISIMEEYLINQRQQMTKKQLDHLKRHIRKIFVMYYSCQGPDFSAHTQRKGVD